MSHVFLVTAEDSGDAFGADVIDALRAADPSVRISGIGGERMRERGAHTAVDMSGLAVLGLVEGLKAAVDRRGASASVRSVHDVVVNQRARLE